MDIDANPLRGYTKKNLRLTDYEVVDGLEIDDLGLTHCGILDIPAESSVFLEHSEDKGTRRSLSRFWHQDVSC